jgi:hypothetical protein
MKSKHFINLKSGTKLKLKKGAKWRDFYWDEAFEMNKLGDEGLPTKEDTLDYNKYIMMHFCLEKSVTFLQYLPGDVEKECYIRVKIELPHGLTETTIIDCDFVGKILGTK